MVGPGTVLKGRWKLIKKIGQGAFGEIYNGTDTTTQDPVAVKLERWDNKKAVLKMEVAVLKKLQHCQYACRYVSAALSDSSHASFPMSSCAVGSLCRWFPRLPSILGVLTCSA